MDIDRTLERIGYAGPLRPDLESLRQLQLAFLLRVPFENLDIHLGREITLSPQRTHEKIVGARRGGFCYECNGLFADLLSAVGFSVSLLSARMALGPAIGPEYDHMVLRVELDRPYLVDVGNGQSCREPLRFDGSDDSVAEGHTYRVGPHGEGLALYYRQADSPWRPRFLFDLRARERADFAEMCRYHQTSPESPFTRQRLVTLAMPRGRVTLSGRRLSMTQGSTTSSRELASEEEYVLCLREHFGLELGAACPDSPPGRELP